MQTTPQSPRLIGLTETMRLVGVKKTAIYSLVTHGQIHPIKLGKRTLFLEEEIFAFINARAVDVRAAMQSAVSTNNGEFSK